MIQLPYYSGGELDRSAHEAGRKRAIFYGSAGFIDPRTWTIDPAAFYLHQRRTSTASTGVIVRSAFVRSVKLAAVTSALSGGAGYLGFDVFNVTPGYGWTPTDDGMTLDGEPHHPIRDLDLTSFMM